MMSSDPTLAQLRAQFGKSRLLSMPIAGTIAWAAIGVFGLVLDDVEAKSMAVFFCMPAVFPIAWLVGKVIGENVFASEGGNDLDRLFMYGILMANLVWCIAIPFWFVAPSSLPLTAGILSGLMWIPLSWILNHWVGLFHAIARSILATFAWFLLPDHRFVAIPAIVVGVYLVSIVTLARRRLPLV